MSDEPITFDAEGTVTVRFKDRTVTLAVPDFGPWSRLSEALQKIGAEYQDALDGAQADLSEAKTDAARRKAEKAINELTRRPFHERTIPWMEEVFRQLGDGPVPPVDEWPAWLAADIQLPARLTTHWKTVPKAFGEKSKN